MLAKQGWCLWRNKDSLCARVLKAKYYADTSVLDAKPKSGMSYSWRSVLRGIIWRVGDGVGLKIWIDPWIPQDGLRQPITPEGGHVLSEVVVGMLSS